MNSNTGIAGTVSFHHNMTSAAGSVKRGRFIETPDVLVVPRLARQLRGTSRVPDQLMLLA